MAIKRILYYLQGTPVYGLLLCRTSCSDLTGYTGGVFGHTSLHFWLCGLPGDQSGVLVGQMTDCRLPFQRGG
jgi:hypothetical protein